MPVRRSGQESRWSFHWSSSKGGEKECRQHQSGSSPAILIALSSMRPCGLTPPTRSSTRRPQPSARRPFSLSGWRIAEVTPTSPRPGARTARRGGGSIRNPRSLPTRSITRKNYGALKMHGSQDSKKRENGPLPTPRIRRAVLSSRWPAPTISALSAAWGRSCPRKTRTRPFSPGVSREGGP